MDKKEFKIKLFPKDEIQLKRWKKELVTIIESTLSEIEIVASTDSNFLGDLIFVSDEHKDMDNILNAFSKKGKALILVTSQAGSIPEIFLNGVIDDVLVEPFRKIEILSKLKSYQEILRWKEVHDINSSFSSLMLQMREDLELAERLQKSQQPKRWPKIQGFKVQSRYFSGLKSGGDYFDFLESKDKKDLSFFLSDASSYGLSSVVLGAFIKIATKVSLGQKQDTVGVVKTIEADLIENLAKKDSLSLFFGVISRENLSLDFLHLGESKVFLYRPKDGLTELESQGLALSHRTSLSVKKSKKIKLKPLDRILLLSDGAVECLNLKQSIQDFLFKMIEKDPKGFLNEIAIQVKSGFKNEEKMPSQDCTAMVIDVASNVVHLKKAV